VPCAFLSVDMFSRTGKTGGATYFTMPPLSTLLRMHGERSRMPPIESTNKTLGEGGIIAATLAIVRD
jgi:hypothetical protein